jgi:hypothetical protein
MPEIITEHPGQVIAAKEAHLLPRASIDSVLERSVHTLLAQDYTESNSTEPTADYGEDMRRAYDVASWRLSTTPARLHIAAFATARAHISLDLDEDQISARLWATTGTDALVCTFKPERRGVELDASLELHGDSEPRVRPIIFTPYYSLVAIRTVRRIVESTQNDGILLRNPGKILNN